MPRICSFYGIVIWIYWDDHNPPHFHSTYGEFEVLIRIQDLSVYSGHLPSRALGLAIEWAPHINKNCWKIGNLFNKAFLQKKLIL